MKEEDTIFLQHATEALISESENSDIDPTIKELLRRVNLGDNSHIEEQETDKSGQEVHVPRSNEYLENILKVFYQDQANAFQRTTLDYNHSLTNKDIKLNENESRQDSNPLHNQETTSKISKSESIKPRKHSKIHSESDERAYKCKDCHLAFYRSSDLRRHEKIHLAILPNVCTQCGKGFARKDALKRHYNTLTCRRNRIKMLTLQEGDIKKSE